jgi:hypothetical protein
MTIPLEDLVQKPPIDDREVTDEVPVVFHNLDNINLLGCGMG